MSISESQLSTWANQGSITQSSTTYASIKKALEAGNYTNNNFEIFLQGSYGNDTNIFAESDVDVVICYEGAFFSDLNELPLDQKNLFNELMPDGTYKYDNFKKHAREALHVSFSGSIDHGKKAIKILSNGTRRNSDVVVAFEFRRYYRFNGLKENDQYYDRGICFFTEDGKRVINYPRQHSKNCTEKHKQTNNNFKPVVRIFKNMRSKLVVDNIIGKDIAPSYFIEGLLYNVPKEKFVGTYQNMISNILKWLNDTNDRTNFLCANEQYYLLRNVDSVCWPINNGDTFIKAVINLWNNS